MAMTLKVLAVALWACAPDAAFAEATSEELSCDGAAVHPHEDPDEVDVVLLQRHAALRAAAASARGGREEDRGLAAPERGVPLASVPESPTLVGSTMTPLGFYHPWGDMTWNMSIEFQFLHVGKNGGRTLHAEFTQIADLNRAEMLGHTSAPQATKMCTTHKNKYIFFVRAPVARFVSAYMWEVLGYYGNGTNWDGREVFKSADELGCALDSPNATTRRAAEDTFDTILHAKWDLNHYWNGLENLKACIDQVYFVGRTEHFEDDVNELVEMLGREHAINASAFTPMYEHEASSKATEKLGELGPCAVNALKKYYRRDYEIIDYLASVGKLSASYPEEIRRIDVPAKP